MKKARTKPRRGNSLQITKQIGIFGKDLALDTAGELLDLGVGTLTGLSTLGFYTSQPGEFNPRRRNAPTQQGARRKRR